MFPIPLFRNFRYLNPIGFSSLTYFWTQPIEFSQFFQEYSGKFFIFPASISIIFISADCFGIQENYTFTNSTTMEKLKF